MSDREMPRVEHGGLRYAQRNVIAPYSEFEVCIISFLLPLIILS